MAHTPTPWQLVRGELVRVGAMGPGNRQLIICGVHRMGKFGGPAVGTPEANAALIVKAVNNWDEAVAIIEELSADRRLVLGTTHRKRIADFLARAEGR